MGAPRVFVSLVLVEFNKSRDQSLKKKRLNNQFNRK